MITLGFDTSNYTTSIAAFDGKQPRNCSQLLQVKPGQLGLRQSDALFAHIKGLPELADRLFLDLDASQIGAIGVSTRPRAVEGSYMPCFLAGQSQATVLARLLHVPLYEFSHQQGHIAAALWSAGRMELMHQPHLAWHLSGGTTELLLVSEQNGQLHAEKIGGTTDISAGQIIDRTGKLLGCPFPSGKAIDQLAAQSDSRERFKIRCQGLQFSFSGLENQMQQFFARTRSAEATARFVLLSVIDTIARVSDAAQKEYPGLPVVLSGGVASNSLLRREFAGRDAAFAAPEYSTDNAMGIALLAWLQGESNGA